MIRGTLKQPGRESPYRERPAEENLDLFRRKAGEEIVDQLYHFEIHGRHLALRPELTPSISRLVIARAGARVSRPASSSCSETGAVETGRDSGAFTSAAGPSAPAGSAEGGMEKETLRDIGG